MENCGCGSGGSRNCGTGTKRLHGIRTYWGAIISLLLLVGGITMEHLEVGWFAVRPVGLVWYVAAYLPVALPVLCQAWKTLRRREVFTEFTLMSLATFGAFYIGAYPEAVAVMLFYAVGEHFQESAVNRAKRHIGALLDVRPETATVVRDGLQQTVPPDTVAVGETLEVKAGERIPLDGMLESESAIFNASALTGESLPLTVSKGEEVRAGMIVTDRVVRISVTRPYDQSALARIIELVRHASERKAPAERFIRRFARIYTPVVVALAALIVLVPWVWSLFDSGFLFRFDDWLYRGLVFLVVSCPCALVVSIPLGYFGGIGLASRHGILFKGSNYLDVMLKVNTVVMDKTGTLTEGVFDVRQVVTAPDVSENELLRSMASAEVQSNHPVAKAIVAYALRQGIVAERREQIREYAGLGLEAVSEGSETLVGNTRLLDKFRIGYPEELADVAETTVVCAIDGLFAGYLVVADALKADARQAVEALQEAGVDEIVILSGDRQTAVTRLARQLGIREAYGDLLPEGKVAHLENLKSDPSRVVAFVGDGLNDAPVLALSDVGIAMGGLGSDVAIETADVVIQTDHPSKVALAIRTGQLTRRTVLQNVSLAFGVKLIVMILGAGGLATLWEAVFADVGVALLAILNASRLLNKRL